MVEQDLENIIEVLKVSKIQLKDNISKILFNRIFNLMGNMNPKIKTLIYENVIIENFQDNVPTFNYNKDKHRVEMTYEDKTIYLIFEFKGNSIIIYNQLDYPANDYLYNKEVEDDYKNFLEENKSFYYIYHYDDPNYLLFEQEDYYFCDMWFDNKGKLIKKEEQLHLSGRLFEEVDRLQKVADYLYAKIQKLGKKIKKDIEEETLIDESTYEEADMVKEYITMYENYEAKLHEVITSYNNEERVIISVTDNNGCKYSFCVNENKFVRQKEKEQ